MYECIGNILRDQPEPTARVLHELRDIILTVAPDAQEVTNYGIVAFALVPGGKRDTQIMIAGYKHHVGFYPSPAVIEHFEKDISTYTYAKGSIQFPLDVPLPRDLIMDMVRYKQSLLTT